MNETVVRSLHLSPKLMGLPRPIEACSLRDVLKCVSSYAYTTSDISIGAYKTIVRNTLFDFFIMDGEITRLGGVGT